MTYEEVPAMKEAVSNLILKAWCQTQSLYHSYRKSFAGRQDGASTVEYALLIAVVVVMVIAAATYMFEPLKEFFLSVVKKIQGIADKSTAKSNF